MILIFTFILIIIGIVAYVHVLKPYLIILQLKKSFQAKGYKVYVQQLNFFKPQYLTTLQQNSQKHNDAYWDLKTKYQGYDIVLQNIMNKVFIILCGIDLVKQAYQKIQFIEKSTQLRNNFMRIYGGGLVMSEGKQWREKRKLYSEIFNFKLLEQLHPHIEEVTKRTVSIWKTDSQINVHQEFRKLLFNSFVVSYFGTQFQGFSYKNQAYGESICRLFQSIFHQAFDIKNILFGTKMLEKGLTIKDKEIQQHLEIIKSQTKQFFIRRVQEISNKKQGSQNNILSKLVFNQYFKQTSSAQKDKKINDIVGDVLIFFFAGTDTTTGVLTVTLHMLNKYPQVKYKLLEELKQLQKSDSVNIKSLKYMDAVLNETLRMYGPANSIIIRQSKGQTSLADVKIPYGAYISLQAMTIHFSEYYYQKPLEFKPQRWLEKKNQNPFSFISFGAGKRNCIGQHLARTEYKIILSYILRNYQFQTKEQFKMHLPFTYDSANNKFKFTRKQTL